MILKEYHGRQWAQSYSSVAPGLDEYATEALERMFDGGMSISIFCEYGRRDYPREAYLMQTAHHRDGTYQIDLARVPIPVFVTGDVRLPRYHVPQDFGVQG